MESKKAYNKHMVHPLCLFILSILMLLPFHMEAAELNAGFVQGLWYGTEVSVANKPTRIYVALRNNTAHDLTGTVRFTDNGTRIGVSSVSALPGRLVEAWVDWTPSYGEHVISASLTNVQVHTVGETPETATVENTIAEDTVFVDYDTDADSIPNEKDTDDDNDAVSDTDEKTLGTNPLKVDKVTKEEKENKKDSEEKGPQINVAQVIEASSDAGIEEVLFKSQSGLERYVPNPAVKKGVGTVTETINDTKTSLDAYRAKRADTIREYFSRKEAESNVSDAVGSSTGSVATITRSIAETKQSFLKSVIGGGKTIVLSIYTFILWVFSNALAHPAILELIVLIMIISFFYRTARRLGRRRVN